MPRRSTSHTPETIAHPDWRGILEAALEHEGSTGDTYNRVYQYSMGNIAFLMYQGLTPQPVANYKRWQELGRQVQRGATAYWILRPIVVKTEELDDNGQPRTIQRFRPVKSVFPISMTEGDELPPFEHPKWRKERALGKLAIREVPFENFNGNVQGQSFGRDLAINPLARYPHKTLMHEMGHIVLGHTTGLQIDDSPEHEGAQEFEAEGTAHLMMNELELMTEDMAAVSRGYVQQWMRNNEPSDRSVRKIFKATDTILRAGRPPYNADNSTT